MKRPWAEIFSQICIKWETFAIMPLLQNSSMLVLRIVHVDADTVGEDLLPEVRRLLPGVHLGGLEPPEGIEGGLGHHVNPAAPLRREQVPSDRRGADDAAQLV